MNNKELVENYYNNWVKRDREAVRDVLSDNFVFRSPQDVFYSADSFLNGCWHYGNDVDKVKFIKKVFQNDEAFVLLEWFHRETNTSFHDTEYIRIENGKFKEILVIINDPEFYRILMRKK